MTRTPPAKQHFDVLLKRNAKRDYGGSHFPPFTRATLCDLANSLFLHSKMSDETKNREIDGVLAAFAGLAPRNEVEALLMAQMIAAHKAGSDCMRRAMIEGQPEPTRHANLGFANQFSRTFATLVETLVRYRAKGKQRVQVRHVHVHQSAGAQAIIGVGDVDPGRARGVARIGKRIDGGEIKAIAAAPRRATEKHQRREARAHNRQGKSGATRATSSAAQSE